MRAVLLGLAASIAAIAVTSAPAGAQETVGIGIPNAKVFGGSGPHRPLFFRHRCRDAGNVCIHRGFDRRFDGGFAGDGGGWWSEDSAWALYNNRSWEPDSYNDWWHDRTDRAFPRWVQESGRQGACDPNRMWWSGAGWRC